MNFRNLLFFPLVSLLEFYRTFWKLIFAYKLACFADVICSRIRAVFERSFLSELVACKVKQVLCAEEFSPGL